jgi:hypothetical protein
VQHRAVGRLISLQPGVADLDGSPREWVESGDGAQDRRLAAARRPAERDQITRTRIEVDGRQERPPAPHEFYASNR